MNEYSKRESMENQTNVFFDVFTDSSSEEEEYELCDHEYKIRSKGHVTCLSCGLQVMDATLLLPEEGYEDRVTVCRSSVGDLRDMVEWVIYAICMKTILFTNNC